MAKIKPNTLSRGEQKARSAQWKGTQILEVDYYQPTEVGLRFTFGGGLDAILCAKGRACLLMRCLAAKYESPTTPLGVEWDRARYEIVPVADPDRPDPVRKRWGKQKPGAPAGQSCKNRAWWGAVYERPIFKDSQ